MYRCAVFLMIMVPWLAYAAGEKTWLDTLDLSSIQQDWQTAQANRSVQGNRLSIAGKKFERGVGTHATSKFAIDLQGAGETFSACVGVDDEMKGHPASVEFRVIADGKLLWSSGVMKVGDSAKRAKIDVKGVALLELRVTDGGDGIDSDHADWADAFVVATHAPRSAAGTENRFLPMTIRPGWNALRFDRSIGNSVMQIGGRPFATGLGTRTNSDVIIAPIGGPYDQFECWVGVDAETPAGTDRGARFRVFVDGVERYVSPAMKLDTPAEHVLVSVDGARELRLVAEHVGQGDAGEAVDWASPYLRETSVPATQVSQPQRTMEAAGLKTGLSSQGEIVALEEGHPFFGFTRLAGCVVEGEVVQRGLDGGGVEYEKTLRDPVHDRRCVLVERFLPTKDSLRWEVEIRGQGEPWSTAIDTCLKYPDAAKAQTWTAWSDPDMRSTGWQDPLVTRPFSERRLWYGAPFFREDKPLVGYCPVYGDTFAIPIFMIAEPETNRAVSLVLSPEDVMLDLVLTTSEQGGVTFSRIHHRISAERPVRFAMDLVTHAADWRAAMGWMVNRYPQYFESTNPNAHAMAGCGAYSGYEGDLDVGKFKKMAFRINWKASFDFPYMGMFLPPVKDDDEPWPRFDAYTPGKHTTTSIRQMNDYAARMQAMGFHVLSYFNVTELGFNVKGPDAVNKDVPEGDVWKNANDFVFTKVADGVLYSEDGAMRGTWGGAVSMDPVGPNYQAHLLDQAKRHIEKIPASEGICIDRLDWLRFFNSRADDGVSWRNGKPVRSLFMSWQEIMDKLGPLMHQAGKVIFVNNHLKRIELLRHVDGIYCEFGHIGPAINTIALLGVHKPVLAWTAHENDLKPDPDAFFQRYLHLGMYPTAPFPQNDHTIGPNEWAEKYYLDYGPLLDAIRGKKWVLLPDIIQVAGEAAKTNLFEVPGGFVMPVTFGGQAPRATVTLKDPQRWLKGSGLPVCEALHPGNPDPMPVAVTKSGPDLDLEVPLVRGCAIISVMPSGSQKKP